MNLNLKNVLGLAIVLIVSVFGCKKADFSMSPKETVIPVTSSSIDSKAIDIKINKEKKLYEDVIKSLTHHLKYLDKFGIEKPDKLKTDTIRQEYFLEKIYWIKYTFEVLPDRPKSSVKTDTPSEVLAYWVQIDKLKTQFKVLEQKYENIVTTKTVQSILAGALNEKFLATIRDRIKKRFGVKKKDEIS